MLARLQVWARAQGFAEQPDSINGFLLSMLAAHLAATGSLVSLLHDLLCTVACAYVPRGYQYAQAVQ